MAAKTEQLNKLRELALVHFPSVVTIDEQGITINGTLTADELNNLSYLYSTILVMPNVEIDIERKRISTNAIFNGISPSKERWESTSKSHTAQNENSS